jgi:hypothetical protein
LKEQREKIFWTGGFRHEIQVRWSWCTRDIPEPIDDRLLSLLDENKAESTRGDEQPKNSDYLKCMTAERGFTELQEKNCDSKAYLLCTSTERFTPVINVGLKFIPKLKLYTEKSL